MNKITETAQAVLEERFFISGEKTWEDLTTRCSSYFGKDNEEQIAFKEVLDNFDFLPNSPALMNACTEIKAYSACYVLPVEDSIDSIFKYYSDAGLISKSGGGVGANFSAIRSSGSVVNSTDGVASGPISFLQGQDALTDVIKQGGRRRGANMGILNCDHPDILDFVKAKDTSGSLENFNLSVGITDEFMEDVFNGDPTDVTDPIGSSRVLESYILWDDLVKRAWNSAEPGVVFLDTLNKSNPVPHLGKIEATNPCGEQPLLPYESCTLGSINLSNQISPAEYDLDDGGLSYPAEVDWDKLKETVRTGVLFLNRILDKSEMPIPECQEAMEKTRKIGLGIMGLHDMLIQLELPYDSEEGREVAGEVMKFISEVAAGFSRKLGEEEGCYTGYAGSLPRRNACLTTIAPTGTLSMLADCSSGCEPYYSPITYKTVLDNTTFAMPNKWLPEEVRKAVESEEVSCIPQVLEALFKGANDIHWSDHVKMQAVLQEHVDSSISKTINMPNSATVEDVKGAYELAYKLGCKGITVYRDGSRETQVLTSESIGASGDDLKVEGGSLTVAAKATLPDVLNAKRYRVSVEGHKVYILVAEDASGDPMEVFVKFPYESIDNCWHIVCRQLSLSMRCGVPLEDIIKQLDKSVVVINDVASHLSRVLKMYQQSMGVLVSNLCPKCGQPLIFTEGCEKCQGCGWSKCG